MCDMPHIANIFFLRIKFGEGGVQVSRVSNLTHNLLPTYTLDLDTPLIGWTPP